MSTARVALHQLSYDARTFFRNGQAVVGVIVQPLLFMVIAVAIFGDERQTHYGIDNQTYFVGAISSLGTMAATWVSLTILLTEKRETGLLKRLRGTPLPPVAYVAAQVMLSVLVAVGLTGIVFVVGRIAYGVTIPVHALPGFAVGVVSGAVAWSCLAFAAVAVISSQQAALPLTQLVSIPLNLMSGVFVPISFVPGWMADTAKVFPVYRIVDQLLVALDPRTSGSAVQLNDVAVLAAWSAFGLGIALWRFDWRPHAERD